MIDTETTKTAPDGAHFDYDEVKTSRGETSLGKVPLLVWDDLDRAVAYFGGNEAILSVLDGTSLRVSYQGIARRLKSGQKAEQSDQDVADAIAQAQIDFRPGKRAGGASTPESRAKRAAANAVEKTGNADFLTQFLEKVAAGEVSLDQLAALTGQSAE